MSSIEAKGYYRFKAPSGGT